jgi:photosystem II stability/assembly factor-like uncharacterized protein
VPTLDFVSRDDGFAYVAYGGPLYVTHDGGDSWHPTGRRAPVAALAAGGDHVYAIFGRSRFERASVSSDAWQTLPLPVKQGLPASIAVLGRDVWLLGLPRRSRPDDGDELARSTDGGKTFSAGRGPCFSELGGTLVPAGAGRLWALCSGGHFTRIFRSPDGGRSFVLVRGYSQANGATLAAASVRVAVLDRGVEGPLLRTTDGGRRWKAVRGTGRLAATRWLAFSTSRVGAAVVQVRGAPTRGELWRTTDGGGSWHKVPLR